MVWLTRLVLSLSLVFTLATWSAFAGPKGIYPYGYYRSYDYCRSPSFSYYYPYYYCPQGSYYGVYPRFYGPKGAFPRGGYLNGRRRGGQGWIGGPRGGGPGRHGFGRPGGGGRHR